MTAGPGPGLLILNKPPGITSHDCIAKLRRLLGQSRIGHAGTLDPLASGVLLVLVGEATVEQDRYMEMDKEYRLRAQFGCRTDSGDRDGRALAATPYRAVSFSRLEKILKAFEGDQWQVPPRFAAIKKGGRPLYAWTRAGVDIERAPRSISIHRCELLSLSSAFWEARVICSKGTYIRSWVEDVAAQLDTSAVLDRLVRERIGPYRLEQAWTLEKVASLASEGHFETIYQN